MPALSIHECKGVRATPAMRAAKLARRQAGRQPLLALRHYVCSIEAMGPVMAFCGAVTQMRGCQQGCPPEGVA